MDITRWIAILFLVVMPVEAQASAVYAHWFATNGVVYNNQYIVVYGATYPAPNLNVIAARVSQCTHVPPQNVQQLVNYGTNIGPFEQQQGQLFTQCP